MFHPKKATDGRADQALHDAAYAVTVEMPASRESGSATLDRSVSASSRQSDSGVGHVAVVEGSGPRLSDETAGLLRRRLLAAAVLLTFAFGLFYIRNLFLDRRDLVLRLYHAALFIAFLTCCV